MKVNKLIKIFLACALFIGNFYGAASTAYASQGDEFTIVNNGVATDIYVDANDHAGVVRVASDLQQDIYRVTGVLPNIVNDLSAASERVIILGTLGSSTVIDTLVQGGSLSNEVTTITGKWESSVRVVVENPFDDIHEALIIAGSDRRGTIYGVYDVSELIGVSPWYWWADVEPTQKDSISINTNLYYRNEPDVKYRGIFINDEWNLKEWSKSLDPDANIGPNTYEKVYELLLRLKANYLQPAMHPYSDNFTDGQDDVLNHKLADKYGIVIGSAQPMFRQNRTEWNPFAQKYQQENGYKPGFDFSIPENRPAILQYWEERVESISQYEIAWSLGMRGLGDSSMQASRCHTKEEKAELLELIIEEQRKLLRKHVLEDENGDLSDVLQVFAVYKEVLELYNAGLKESLPQDISIKWSEDNHAHIRQLPDESEQAREGGNTLYYHLSYWGAPKSYLWLSTTPLSLLCEELDKAYDNNIREAWIFNVGDIKPAELALDYVMNKSWDIDSHNKEMTEEFISSWVSDKFEDSPSDEVAEIMVKFNHLGISRRPEFLHKGIFSLENNSDEWTRRLAEYEGLFTQINDIYESGSVDEELKDAFYQLFVYPIRGAYYHNKKFYYTDKYYQGIAQGRGESTNIASLLANKAEEEEFAETYYYNNQISGGKWNKIMNPYPSKIPKANKIPSMPLVEAIGSGVGVVAEGYSVPKASQQLDFSVYTKDHRFIDVFNKGTELINWSASVSDSWIQLSTDQGTLLTDERVWVSIDYDEIPYGTSVGQIQFTEGDTTTTVVVHVSKPEELSLSDVEGYVEANGYISIECENYDYNIENNGATWEIFKDLGRNNGAIISQPHNQIDPFTSNIKDNAPYVEYTLNFMDAGVYETSIYRIPTLNKEGVRFAISLDNQEPVIIHGNNVIEGHGGNNNAWSKSVLEGIEKLKTHITVDSPGVHSLKIWMVDRSVALDKIVINTGAVEETYYAPAESYHHIANTEPSIMPVNILIDDIIDVLITKAEDILSEVNVGNSVGDYSVEAYDALELAVTEAYVAIHDELSFEEQNQIQNNLLTHIMNLLETRRMEDELKEYVVYEDFQHFTTGSEVKSLDIDRGGNASAVVEEIDNNKYIRLESNSGNIHLNWAYSKISGTIVTEFMINNQSNEWVKAPYMTPGVTCAVDNLKSIKLRNGSQWDTKNNTLSEGWHHVKLIMDTQSNTYAYYLDNELIGNNINFRNPADYMDNIIFGSSEQNADVLIDNVMVYKLKEQVNNLLIEEDFENINVGNVPDNVQIESTSNAICEVVDVDGDKVLSLQSNDGQVLVDWYVEAITLQANLEFSAQVNTQQWVQLPYLKGESQAGVCLAFDDGNKLKARDGDEWVIISEVTEGTWYNIKIFVDVENQTYDVFMDDVLIASSIDFRNNVSSINNLRIGSSEGNANVIIDNVTLEKVTN